MRSQLEEIFLQKKYTLLLDLLKVLNDFETRIDYSSSIEIKGQKYLQQIYCSEGRSKKVF